VGEGDFMDAVDWICLVVMAVIAFAIIGDLTLSILRLGVTGEEQQLELQFDLKELDKSDQ
jgi:hypothetical protein